MRNEPQVKGKLTLKINHSFYIDEDTKVATSTIADCVYRVAEVKRQIKALEKLLVPDVVAIKDYLGEKSELLLEDGSVGATWRQGALREVINKEGQMVLKSKFPDVYNEVAQLEEGIRRLEIKV